MKQIYPDFYPQFHCLAGDCPDTCCKDWEVVIDSQAMRFYESVGGELGERLKEAFCERDGETCFRLREEDGKCVLLTPDGLCPLQTAFGEQGLCTVCASHPRFLEEYGAVQEITLSVSCPEAARLLLEHPEPIRFLTKQTEEAVDTPNALDPERYFAVRQLRDAAIRLAQDRSRSIRDRLSLILLLCVRAEPLLEKRKYGAMQTICMRFLTHDAQERQLLRLRRLRRKSADFFPMWLLLRNMEHLTAEFPVLLEQGTHAPRPDAAFFGRWSGQLENLTVYFLFRYLLKAAAGGSVMEKAGACVFHVLAIERLFALLPEQTPQSLQRLCGLYSKEVEHAEENLQTLYRALRHGALRSAVLFSLI